MARMPRCSGRTACALAADGIPAGADIRRALSTNEPVVMTQRDCCLLWHVALRQLRKQGTMTDVLISMPIMHMI
jgi:hypothetical protein